MGTPVRWMADERHRHVPVRAAGGDDGGRVPRRRSDDREPDARALVQHLHAGAERRAPELRAGGRADRLAGPAAVHAAHADASRGRADGASGLIDFSLFKTCRRSACGSSCGSSRSTCSTPRGSARRTPTSPPPHSARWRRRRRTTHATSRSASGSCLDTRTAQWLRRGRSAVGLSRSGRQLNRPTPASSRPTRNKRVPAAPARRPPPAVLLGARPHGATAGGGHGHGHRRGECCSRDGCAVIRYPSRVRG